MQREQSETGYDEWFKDCINDASRMVEEMCKRDFWYHDHSSTLLLAKTLWIVGDIIFLPWPVKTLTEIQMDDVAIAADDWTYENNDVIRGGAKIFHTGGISWAGYNVIEEGDTISNKYRSIEGMAEQKLFGVHKGPTTIDPTLRTIKLKGTFGYTLANPTDTDTMPTDLPGGVMRACTLIAAAMTGMNRKEVQGLEGGIESFTEYRIPKEAKDLLKGYTRLVL